MFDNELLVTLEKKSEGAKKKNFYLVNEIKAAEDQLFNVTLVKVTFVIFISERFSSNRFCSTESTRVILFEAVTFFPVKVDPKNCKFMSTRYNVDITTLIIYKYVQNVSLFFESTLIQNVEPGTGCVKGGISCPGVAPKVVEFSIRYINLATIYHQSTEIDLSWGANGSLEEQGHWLKRYEFSEKFLDLRCSTKRYLRWLHLLRRPDIL